jgi:preprotein translocase SecE subunit
VAEAKKQPRRLKKTETVRERAEKAAVPAPEKPRRLRRTAGQVGRPLKRAAHVGRKEYYLPLPDNRLGRFLNKRRHVIPRFFREAWQELRDVTWPGRRETWQLSLAVFVFAIIFGLLIAVTDYGLDKLFKRVFLK